MGSSRKENDFSLTELQKAISDGGYDLNPSVGDYWIIDGQKFCIVDVSPDGKRVFGAFEPL